MYKTWKKVREEEGKSWRKVKETEPRKIKRVEKCKALLTRITAGLTVLLKLLLRVSTFGQQR